METVHENIFEKQYDETNLIELYNEVNSIAKQIDDAYDLIDNMEVCEPKLTKIAEYILRDRYLWRKGDRQETPFELFNRVATAVSDALLADKKIWKERFLKLLTNLYFLPNSPTLMNAGRNREAQLSACFVIPVEDSMEGIYKALMDQAITQKMGGGTGFSFSRLRSKGQEVSTTHGVASGVLSFMSLFDLSSEIVQQGGMRRGANMGVLNYNHPEIIDFIKAKDPENRRLTNFNISVAVTDAFMRAVETNNKIALIDPHTKKVHTEIPARDLFNLIVHQAWKTGDPGLIFIDNINRYNTFMHYKLIEATNPCGEEPLLPYGACNLGSINLEKIVENNVINYELLKQIVKVATVFLDAVVTINQFPLKENYDVAKNTRDIGLGVMGFAHMLMKLGVPYDSKEAINIAEKIIKTIQATALYTSKKLAEANDVFPWYDRSIWAKVGIPVRNANLTSIAPTGSISIIANTSSGIEPVFALSYERRILFGSENETTYTEFNKILTEKCDIDETTKNIIATNGSIQDIDKFDDETKAVFKTSLEIDYRAHIAIQAAFQKYTNAGVSKTINFKSNANESDIADAYKYAWQHGCKGITVYRDLSKSEQVISTNKQQTILLRGVTGRLKTDYGKIYLTLNYKNSRPFETFINIAKSGKDAHATAEAIGRLISIALQHGVDINEIIKQLRGIGGEGISFDKIVTLSLPDAIAALLEIIIKRVNINNTIDIIESDETVDTEACPICGAKLVFADGCATCPKCGYSRCS